MPMNFCLPKDRVEAFTEGLRSGEINPESLIKMTSKERSNFLGKYVGEGAAKRVNAEFESKTLLKNQQQGMINWAKNVTGIKPAVRRDLVKRIQDLEKVLDPKEKEAFLEDLASVRLGADVTQEEAQTIANMSKSLQESKAKMGKDYTFPSFEDRIDYGRNLVKMEDYVSDLKNETKKFRLSDIKNNPVTTGLSGISKGAGLAKSITASLDNSVIGRQGLKVLLTHPKIWLKNAKQSFVDMARTYGGKQVMDEVRAEIYSRPNALNGLYKREKLALGNAEEAYPTSLPEKIPILGRAFKASENAFTAFQYRTRADLMDQFANMAEKAGADIKGMGIIANGLTGRGNVGKLEPVANELNNVFFSPRFVKSNIDALTGHALDYGKLGKMAKKEAAKNTVKIITGIGGVLALAHAINPDAVDLDPRSTDFGKIKIGNTRFDVAGGMSGLVTLAARGITQSSKSSTGKITQLNSDEFGSPNYGDLLMNFVGNKLSPAGQVVKDLLTQKTFEGDKPTVGSEAKKLLVPIGVQNYLSMKDHPNSANIILAMLSDALGIGTNTYSQNKKDSWKNTTSKELSAFKETVGEERFKQANKEFDDTYNTYVDKVSKTEAFRKLSQEDQQSLLSRKKTQIKNQVLTLNGFEYEAPEKDTSKVDELSGD